MSDCQDIYFCILQSIPGYKVSLDMINSLQSSDIIHLNKYLQFLLMKFPSKMTRNTVSNAHKMIPHASPCFVW